MFMILSALPLYSYTTLAAIIGHSHSESLKFAIDDNLMTAASSVAHSLIAEQDSEMCSIQLLPPSGGLLAAVSSVMRCTLGFSAGSSF